MPKSINGLQWLILANIASTPPVVVLIEFIISVAICLLGIPVIWEEGKKKRQVGQ